MQEQKPPWSRLRPLPVIFVVGLFVVLWLRRPAEVETGTHRDARGASATGESAPGAGDGGGELADAAGPDGVRGPAREATVTSLSADEIDGEHLVRLEGQAMGTSWHATVVTREDEAARAAIAAAIVGALASVDHAMSTYRADSELSRLNRLPAGETMTLSPATAAVLALALRVSDESGGAFDVTVGPLVRAWGFAAKARADAPDDAEIAALAARVDYRLIDLHADSGEVTKRGDGVEIDLSAIAKGYAVDAAAKALRQAGQTRFLVEVGGEVVTAGMAVGGRPWRLGVERPDADPGTVQQVAVMIDGALATSGDYRNVRLIGGKRYNHTIDPRTGRPVTHQLASVSVRAASCAEADAMATALAVLGPEAGMALAHRLDLAAYFLVRRDDGSFDERATPRWQLANDTARDQRP